MKPIIIAIYGVKNSGKTYLATNLIKRFKKRGFKIASIKYIHHEDVDVDKEGKDSWKHKEAGAEAVAGLAKKKLFIIENSDSEEKGLKILLDHLKRYINPDIIIIEGSYQLTHNQSHIHKIILSKKGEKNYLNKDKLKNLIGIYTLTTSDKEGINKDNLEKALDEIGSYIDKILSCNKKC